MSGMELFMEGVPDIAKIFWLFFLVSLLTFIFLGL
jgi:hypothetical protein